jgi:hypothetical protein
MDKLLQENGDTLLQETGDALLLDIFHLPFRTRIGAVITK